MRAAVSVNLMKEINFIPVPKRSIYHSWVNRIAYMAMASR